MSSGKGLLRGAGLEASSRAARRSRAKLQTGRLGFTLLEVMAAVALLGFTVTVLARGAIQGMRYEGDASRRLAASLIADRALFEVESSLALGAAPQPTRLEREEGEFRLLLEVAPLDPAALGIPGLFSRTPAEPATATSAQGPVPILLLVTVQVAWTEGLVEQAVTRTSFAYDATAVAAALEAAEGAEEAAAEPAAPEAPEAPEEGEPEP